MADLSHSQLRWYMHSSPKLSGHSNCTEHARLCAHHKSVAKAAWSWIILLHHKMLQCVTNLPLWSNYHYTSGDFHLVTDVCFTGICSIKLHFRQMCYTLSPCLKLTIKTINTRNTKCQKMMDTRCCGRSLLSEISKLKELWSPSYYCVVGAEAPNR